MKNIKPLLQNTLRILALILIIWTIEGCSKDDSVEPGGGSGGGTACDLSNVTFTNTVMPIISANCTSCHTTSNASGGILLIDHATVRTQAMIAAGSPGSLMGAITHASGNTAMPQGRAKLSDCNIDKIRTWINAGMPDN